VSSSSAKFQAAPSFSSASLQNGSASVQVCYLWRDPGVQSRVLSTPLYILGSSFFHGKPTYSYAISEVDH
jgi:hypothetical protein